MQKRASPIFHICGQGIIHDSPRASMFRGRTDPLKFSNVEPILRNATVLMLAAAFVVGAALLESERSLPDPMWCAWLPVAAWLALMRFRASPLPAAFAGYAWAACAAHLQMGASLPPEINGTDVEITGTVRGLPDVDSLRARFDLDVHADSPARVPPGRVRLSWFRASTVPAPGSVWRMTVRLRRPLGWRNPGGSDYEGWSFANRIVATGYVRSARRIGSAPPLSLARVDAVRAGLAEWIRSALAGHDSDGLVRALAIGDRRGISERRWQTLRETGIAHLMAISGLHVGMAAGTAYWASLRAWTLVPRAALLLAAPQVAALAAMAAATGYALLAGLALPTQRALLMLAVVFASRLSRRCILPSDALALALLLVVVIDPHSVRAPGFWLSFVAVAVILLAIATRPTAHSRTVTGRLRTLARVQIAVTVGLAPVTLAVFAEQSLVSPLVNAVMIPLVGTMVVPVILVGLLTGVFVPDAGAAMLGACALVLDTVWPTIEWIGAHAPMLRAPGAIGGWQIAAAAVGVLIVLAPRGATCRWLGFAWMLPMLAVGPAPIGTGAYRMTVLDVGHGLSVVVETAGHVLVYDTGPRIGSRLDAAALAVLPYLAWRGHAGVDRVVLSHGDSDHVGGFRRLAESIAVASVMANGVVASRQPDSPCTAGRRWDWDGVSFEVLHPFAGAAGFDNDDSCVIRIAGPGGIALLTGDIERAAEKALVSREGKGLSADVLMAAHHGSNTSSTPVFLDAVSPSIALSSAARGGRVPFPHPRVVSRYADAGIPMYSTSHCGAITIEFSANRARRPRISRLERETNRRYWHAQGLQCAGAPSPRR